ncbi:hypothetical protein RJ55_03982 [Drechmeria coniospora]|nr:hypothetical protein RJ55_03982 [Drechmeria coniospora]
MRPARSRNWLWKTKPHLQLHSRTTSPFPAFNLHLPIPFWPIARQSYQRRVGRHTGDPYPSVTVSRFALRTSRTRLHPSLRILPRSLTNTHCSRSFERHELLVIVARGS